MQKFVSKYGFAAHLALLAVAPLFLPPQAILWLAGLTLFWLVLEPSRIGGEQLHEARHRVRKGVLRDPLTWVMLIIAGTAGFRCLNDGVKMAYDAEIIKWTLAEPVFPLFPGAVEGVGFPEFAAAVALLVVLAGCRKALGKQSRKAFCLVSSAIAGIYGLVLVVRMAGGDAALEDLSTCALARPSFMGPIFGVFLIAGIVALAGAFVNTWRIAIIFTIPAIVGNLAGLFLFSPPIVSVTFAGAAIIVFLYAFFHTSRASGHAAELKMLVVFGLSVVSSVMLMMSFLPGKIINSKVDAIVSGAFVPEDYVAMRDALSNISLESWKDHPWVGTGLGSFSLDLRFRATEADWLVIAPDQAAPLNGYWLLLSERGIIGAFLLACPLVLLLITYVMRLIRGVTVALPAPECWAGLLMLLIVAAEGVVDVSILQPGLLTAVAAFFALAASAFPKGKRRKDGR